MESLDPAWLHGHGLSWINISLSQVICSLGMEHCPEGTSGAAVWNWAPLQDAAVALLPSREDWLSKQKSGACPASPISIRCVQAFSAFPEHFLADYPPAAVIPAAQGKLSPFREGNVCSKGFSWGFPTGNPGLQLQHTGICRMIPGII